MAFEKGQYKGILISGRHRHHVFPHSTPKLTYWHVFPFCNIFQHLKNPTSKYFIIPTAFEYKGLVHISIIKLPALLCEEMQYHLPFHRREIEVLKAEFLVASITKKRKLHTLWIPVREKTGIRLHLEPLRLTTPQTFFSTWIISRSFCIHVFINYSKKVFSVFSSPSTKPVWKHFLILRLIWMWISKWYISP